MKVAGKVDCFFTNVTANNDTVNNPRRWSSEFVSIVSFLSSSNCQNLGIQCIAANRGNGSGFDYWDQTNPVGQNTSVYAVFRFLSGSQGPFECMIWCFPAGAGGTGAPYPMQFGGILPTAPMTNLDGDGGIGIAFACHASGSTTSPWNSSTSLTSGTITYPVWKTGSLGELSVFPRQNSIGGVCATNRNYLETLAGPTANDTTLFGRMHIIATESSLLIARRPTGDYGYLHTLFGPFTPRSELNATAGYPGYFMYTNGGLASADIDPIVASPTTFGTLTANNRAVADSEGGGVSHPYMMEGSGTLTGNFYTITGVNLNYFPNTFASSSYMTLPLWVGVKDSTVTPAAYGLLGSCDPPLNCWVYGESNDMLTESEDTLLIGSYTKYGPRLAIPWSGSMPQSNFSREGRDFYYDDWHATF